MTRWLVVVSGLLIGALLGTGLLLVNPLTFAQPRPVGLAGAVRTLAWEAGDAFRGIDLTPAGLLGAGSGRDPDPGFRDAAIRYARAEVVTLPADGDLPAALGVRLSAIASTNSLLRARLGSTTHWNIVWPGRGTALLGGSENFWRPLRDGLWSALRGRGFRPPAPGYLLPPVPGIEPSVFAAGTGAFDGARGAFREEFTPMAERPGDFAGRRQLQLVLE